MNTFLIGAVAMGSLAASLHFLRFWRDTRDRLFLSFGLSFLIEGLNRTALAMTPSPQEGHPFFYLVRLLSYLLILVAIVEKNLARRPRPAATTPPNPTPATGSDRDPAAPPAA